MALDEILNPGVSDPHCSDSDLITNDELEPSSKIPKVNDSARFATDVTDETISDLKTPFVPVNTKKNNRWAVKNFRDWVSVYNQRNPDDICPPDLLETCSIATELCKWLCIFVATTRSQKGEEYTPRTIHSKLGGIYRYMKTANPSSSAECNFMDKGNANFKELQATCDNLFRALRKKGIGANPKQAAILSVEDEELLWTSDVLGSKSPKALLNAVFFYNGKNFHLRGGEEHRFLKISQIQRRTNPDRYIYVETGSKNRQGGLNDIYDNNKVVPIFSNASAGERCHVFLLDLYLSKLPPEARQSDLFYVNPRKEVTASQMDVWFDA